MEKQLGNEETCPEQPIRLYVFINTAVLDGKIIMQIGKPFKMLLF